MKQKFFSQISDHQQSGARPFRRACLIPPALLVVADFVVFFLNNILLMNCNELNNLEISSFSEKKTSVKVY
jgi:hypothetical protein